jgi:hypothetical protein
MKTIINKKALYELFEKTTKFSKKDFYRYCNGIKAGIDLPPMTEAWINRCYHSPFFSERAMNTLDEICGTYGVETIDASETKNGYPIDYLNTGDPYYPTIVYCAIWINSIKIAHSGYAQYVK